MTESNGNRYCDRCGILLTKHNNKCGYEICNKCNEELEQYVKKHAERSVRNEIKNKRNNP